MSVEFRAGFPCPHMIMEEPVALGADRASLITLAPVASAASVRVLVNDSNYVPAEGLKSQATLKSSSSGPYRILPCSELNGPDANLLTVMTNAGASSIRLPTGYRVSADSIIREIRLNTPLYNLVEPSQEDGVLVLTERNYTGQESTLTVSGRAVTGLGFSQRGARGKTVYPGWGLFSRQSVYPGLIPGVTLVPARYVKFFSPLQGNPTIKVSYAAMPERCVRCGATYVENDYRFDLSGDPVRITNEDLLYQACLKAVLTAKGSNPFHPSYGSQLTKRVGLKIAGQSALLIRQDVQEALQQVKNLQAGQKKYQSVTNKELLYSVDHVDVRPSQEDPTVFFVDVVVRNGSNQPINLTTVFSVPGTIALAGSNGQALGLERAGLTTAQSQRFLLE